MSTDSCRHRRFIVLLLTLIPGVLVCNHLCAVFVADNGGFIQKPISKRLIFVSRLCLNLGCLNLGLGLLSIRGLLLLDKVFVVPPRVDFALCDLADRVPVLVRLESSESFSGDKFRVEGSVRLIDESD